MRIATVVQSSSPFAAAATAGGKGIFFQEPTPAIVSRVAGSNVVEQIAHGVPEAFGPGQPPFSIPLLQDLSYRHSICYDASANLYQWWLVTLTA